MDVFEFAINVENEEIGDDEMEDETTTIVQNDPFFNVQSPHDGHLSNEMNSKKRFNWDCIWPCKDQPSPGTYHQRSRNGGGEKDKLVHV